MATAPITRWMRSRRTLIAVAPVAAIAAVEGLGFRHPARVQVTTATITTGPVVRHIIATGTLQALTTVTVGSQVSGAIRSLAVDYNSTVRAGEVVARIDPALFQAALNEATASLDEARAALLTAEADRNGAATGVEDARTKLQRAEQLAGRQLIPQSDLDAAQIAMGEASTTLDAATSQMTLARAAADQARATVAQAKLNLEHTIITSPVDGIVIARNVDVGQTVAAAVQAPVLFAIATDLRRMQLELDLDEADVADVQPGELGVVSGQDLHGHDRCDTPPAGGRSDNRHVERGERFVADCGRADFSGFIRVGHDDIICERHRRQLRRHCRRRQPRRSAQAGNDGDGRADWRTP